MGEAIESKTSSGIRPLFTVCAKGVESGVKRRRDSAPFFHSDVQYTFSTIRVKRQPKPDPAKRRPLTQRRFYFSELAVYKFGHQESITQRIGHTISVHLKE
jgi:hypothetical protein